MTLYIGIDPGLTGAIAFVSHGGGAVVYDTPVGMSKGRGRYDVQAIAKLLDQHLALANEGSHQALIEEAQMFSKGAVAVASLHLCVGIFEGLFANMRIPYELVAPSQWKKGLGLIGKAKDASRLMAARKFPSIDLSLKKHDGRAEALLLTWWWQHRSEPKP